MSQHFWMVKSDGKRYQIIGTKRLPRKLKKLITRVLNHNTKVVCVSPNYYSMVTMIKEVTDG